jgi:hypothetical protein
MFVQNGQGSGGLTDGDEFLGPLFKLRSKVSIKLRTLISYRVDHDHQP